MASHRRKEKHGVATAVGAPENATDKRRKALLSEEDLLVTKERDKVHKASKRVSETHEQTLHRQEQNQTHLACAEGSVLQYCSFHGVLINTCNFLVTCSCVGTHYLCIF